MNKSQRFGLVLTLDEKNMLGRLAEAEGGLSKAAAVRRLIRQEAERLGLLPNESYRASEPVQDAQHD